MKKLRLLTLATAIALTASASAGAAEKKSASSGPLEISGGIDVLAGWQHDNKNSGTVIGPDGVAGSINWINSADTFGTGRGIFGDYRGQERSNRDTFNFILDSFELDVARNFGENIRVRADLDFGRFASGSNRTTGFNNFLLEQGYITANIPVGNGVELLAGRFNAPIGYESVDRRDNIALSFSRGFTNIRPHNLTGIKVYYPWTDHFDWHLYVVNNLYDTITGDNPLPSFGTRFGLNWGKDKDKQHTVGLSFATGPESPVPHLTTATPGTLVGSNLSKHWTYLANLDFTLHVTDALVVAGDATFRQDNRFGACISSIAKNCRVFNAQLIGDYNFTENFDGYLRYEYLRDSQGNYTNIKGQEHVFSAGAGYKITDGAKLKLEYRLDLGLPSGPAKRQISQGFGANFAYSF